MFANAADKSFVDSIAKSLPPVTSLKSRGKLARRSPTLRRLQAGEGRRRCRARVGCLFEDLHEPTYKQVGTGTQLHRGSGRFRSTTKGKDIGDLTCEREAALTCQP